MRWDLGGTQGIEVALTNSTERIILDALRRGNDRANGPFFRQRNGRAQNGRRGARGRLLIMKYREQCKNSARTFPLFR